MKKLKNEVKSVQKMVIETFLILFVFISFLLGITLYIYYSVNVNYIDELSLLKDIHSLRAEMVEFSEKSKEVGYIEIKEVT
jgi:hypothetical protein